MKAPTMFLKYTFIKFKIVVSVTKARMCFLLLYSIFLCVSRKNTYCLYQKLQKHRVNIHVSVGITVFCLEIHFM